MRRLLLELGRTAKLPVRLRDCGVKPEDFPAIADKALNDGAMIVNPRKADKKDVIRILEKAY